MPRLLMPLSLRYTSVASPSGLLFALNSCRQYLECDPHGNVILWFFRAANLLLLYRHEHLIRNNGLMGAGIKIPIHEAIIFDLDSTSADCFLKQYPSGVFFIGEQFVNRFPVPLGSACGGGDTLPFQISSNFPKAIYYRQDTAQISNTPPGPPRDLSPVLHQD